MRRRGLSPRLAVAGRCAVTSGGHAFNHQLDILGEAFELLLSTVPAAELEVRLTNTRRVGGRLCVDAVVRWRGACPEERIIEQSDAGISFRIVAWAPMAGPRLGEETAGR